MLSWKRRLNDTKSGNVNKEEKIECRIDPRDYDNFIYLTENVVKMIRVEVMKDIEQIMIIMK